MNVHVIESALGHRFLSTDSPDADLCLTCGGVWQLVDRGDGTGRYVNAQGNGAKYCTGRTDLCHGYERHCEADDGRPCAQAQCLGACSHTTHWCNCLLCV